MNNTPQWAPRDRNPITTESSAQQSELCIRVGRVEVKAALQCRTKGQHMMMSISIAHVNKEEM